LETAFRDDLRYYKRENSKIEDVLVADIDEGLELLGELTVQEKERICICMSAQQLMTCLAKHQTKDSHLTQSAAKPYCLKDGSASKRTQRR
jgi:hypothetical protein